MNFFIGFSQFQRRHLLLLPWLINTGIALGVLSFSILFFSHPTRYRKLTIIVDKTELKVLAVLICSYGVYSLYRFATPNQVILQLQVFFFFYGVRFCCFIRNSRTPIVRMYQWTWPRRYIPAKYKRFRSSVLCHIICALLCLV